MQCAAPVSTLFAIGARAHAEMKLQKECRALISLSLSPLHSPHNILIPTHINLNKIKD